MQVNNYAQNCEADGLRPHGRRLRKLVFAGTDRRTLAAQRR